MKIGMIVAIASEIEAMLTELGEPMLKETVCGIDIRKYKVSGNEIYVANSGVGEIYAAGAVQLLVSKYGAELIVNFGICGGLTEEMSLCSTSVVTSVVHYDFDTTAIDGGEVGTYSGTYPTPFIPADKRLIELACEITPSLKPVICASADKFVDSAERKSELNRLYGASICEMEAAGILLTANRCGVPTLMIKAVSDSVSGGADEFAKMASESARCCVRTLLGVLKRL